MRIMSDHIHIIQDVTEQVKGSQITRKNDYLASISV
jgi:REP element-mobilizing transposase RayT